MTNLFNQPAQTFPISTGSNLFSGMNYGGTGFNASRFVPTDLAYDEIGKNLSNVPMYNPDVSSTGLKMPSFSGVGGTPEADFSMKDFANNYGGLILGGLQTGANLFMGMKQYGMAKKAFDESKRQFELNYGAQKNLTNARLEDRQRARLAADPNAYKPVNEYMKQNGVA